MKSKIVVVLLLLITQSGKAQKSTSTINWDPLRPLTWADFKARPENAAAYDALTAGSLSYSFEKISPDEYKLLIHMGFNPQKSWVKPKKTTDKLLVHEQVHFDIFELYTRILVKKLEAEHALTGTKYSEKVKKIFEKNFDELIKFQEKYDKETNHSKNEEKQLEWNVKIKKLLEENKQYTKREMVFKL